MSRNNKIAVQVLGLCVAAVMIIYGVSREKQLSYLIRR